MQLVQCPVRAVDSGGGSFKLGQRFVHGQCIGRIGGSQLFGRFQRTDYGAQKLCIVGRVPVRKVAIGRVSLS